MGEIPSQVIAQWIKRGLSSDWIRIDEVCRTVLVDQMGSGRSEEYISDIVESNIKYVAEHLREELAISSADGVPPEFEIDDETPPYIRLSDVQLRPVLKKLKKLRGLDFEKVCAEILKKLRARADVTGGSHDGGVDFYAIDFDFVPDGIPTPQACRAAVIGQAKQYKDGHTVKETELREFVGGATRRRHDMAVKGTIFPLSPVVFAFWTTSEFDRNAKLYAQALGVWYLSGRALAKYVRDLGVEPFVESLIPTDHQQPHAAPNAE